MAIVHPMLCILISGGTAGGTLAIYATEILNFLRIALAFVNNYPILVTAICALIVKLINFMQRARQPGQIQDNHQ